MSSRKASSGGSRKRKAQANQDESSIHTAPPSSVHPVAANTTNTATANPNAVNVAAATVIDPTAPPPAKRAKKMRDPSIITYVGPEGKIFERIFQESLTLEGMKAIVRKKMKYPEGSAIELAQLRYEPGRDGKHEVKTIDLDDEEDFDVFRYRASDPHAPITISFHSGNTSAPVSTPVGSAQALTPRALPPPPTPSSTKKANRPASQSTTLLSALPKPVINMSPSSSNTTSAGAADVASPNPPSAKKKTQFAPTLAPQTPVAPSASASSSTGAPAGLEAPASAPPILKTSKKRNTPSQSATKGPVLALEPESTPAGSKSASTSAPVLTPTPAPASMVVTNAKTPTPATTKTPASAKASTPAASQKGTEKEPLSKTPSKAATTSEKPAKRRKTSVVPPVSSPAPAASPAASAAVLPSSVPAPASVSKPVPSPKPAQKDSQPQPSSLAPPINLPKSRKSLPNPSSQPISNSEKEKAAEGENDKSWEADKWLPPTLAAAVARRKSMGATPLDLDLDLPSSSAPVTSTAASTSEKEQEKGKESGKEKKEKKKNASAKPVPSPKKQASSQLQTKAQDVASPAVVSPVANSVEMGLPSSYEFGKEKEADESSESEAPATLKPVQSTKGKPPPTPKRSSNLPVPTPSSPINPSTPNQQRTPQRAQSITPLSSPAGPVAPSSPEKQPHSDVYIEDDGEGSTSESSEDDSSDEEDESEEKTKEKDGKKGSEEKNVLAPSSSLPNGLKDALPPPRFSGAPLRSVIMSDDEVENDSDDDDVVHYSDATDSPPKKKRLSMLSQGRGRKSGAFSESEDDEGILPPGVRDPNAEVEEKQNEEREEDDEEEEEEEEEDSIEEEPRDVINGAGKRVQSETIESWSEQGLDSESGSVLVIGGRPNDPPRVLISSPSVRSNESTPELAWEDPPVRVSSAIEVPAVDATPKPRKSLGDLEDLDASQPPLTYSTLNRALDEASELDRVDGDQNGAISQAMESVDQEPEKEDEEKEDKEEDVDISGKPPLSLSSGRGRPVGGDVSRKTSSSSSLIARREEVEVENQVGEADYPESEPPSSIRSRTAPSLPPSSAVNTPSATPRTLTKAEQIRNRRAELVAEKAAAARVKAEEVAAKHEIAIENARKKGKPLSKMLLNYLEKKKIKEEEERAKEEAHADLAILRAGAKQIETQRSLGKDSQVDSNQKQAAEPAVVANGTVHKVVDQTPKVQETPVKSVRPTEDRSSSVTKPTPSKSPQISLPYSRNRAPQPRPGVPVSTSSTPSVYPSIPLPPPSQPIALPSSSQRRAPGLSDLSQRSKAEFAVAGSETARAKAAGRESGVLGRIGGWISGSARGTPIGKQSGAVQDPESESSDDDDDDDEDSSSSDEEGGQSKAIQKAVKARMASGRKVGKPKKSILGSLM